MVTITKETPKQKLSGHLLITASIECCICGESWPAPNLLACEIEEVIPRSLDYFYNAGWRQKESGKFQLIGCMCPRCSKQKDDLRGED